MYISSITLNYSEIIVNNIPFFLTNAFIIYICNYFLVINYIVFGKVFYLFVSVVSLYHYH